ncbi:MAG: hypothetical protein KGH98_00630 [Candidatus Micrarchaeota archaeon]|nr:hypothetical protein [Candidatus Micrarchaeota archaeon]
MSGIDKVHVTEGDYGFIAVARFSSDKGRETIRQLLSKAVGRDLGELTSRYIYKKNRGVL